MPSEPPRLPHAELRYRTASSVPPAARCAVLHWHRDEPMHVPPDELIAGEVLEAFVNEGRWVVQCPCGGAQFAAWSDPRFFCVDCLNEWCGGGWVDVVWPDDLSPIEGALLARPDPRNRHWRPGETVADLIAENEAHLVGDR